MRQLILLLFISFSAFAAQKKLPNFICGLGTTWGESIKVSNIGTSSKVLTFMQSNDHSGKALGANGYSHMGTQWANSIDPENTHELVDRYNSGFADGSVRLLHQGNLYNALLHAPQ